MTLNSHHRNLSNTESIIISMHEFCPYYGMKCYSYDDSIPSHESIMITAHNQKLWEGQQ